MLTIRRIFDAVTEPNRQALDEVNKILRVQFSGLTEADLARILDQLHDPLKYRFRAVLFLAEGFRGQMRGLALMDHLPDLGFCYLDYLSTAPGAGGGVGAALYERVREEAAQLKSVGLFYECLPDDPALCRDAKVRRQNIARLRFYERFGARPIAGTAYETPVEPGGDNPPYLMVDTLGRKAPVGRDKARRIVRAILERKYGHLCPVDYVNKVVASFADDPVRIREPRYTPQPQAMATLAPGSAGAIPLVVNQDHALHHIRERGYVEAPVRMDVLLAALLPTGLFRQIPARHFADSHLTEVHDPAFVNYLKKACALVPAKKSIYPYIFPLRNKTRPPRSLPMRAGYYCIDTFTPLNQNAYIAARGAVDCALTAAQKVLEGFPLAYALVRPPGHHAERASYGGFCYFNSAAVAAHYLSPYGRVAVLDIDYHHGNGTQDIFYERKDVLTVSIHGNPRNDYPYFTGYEDEKGEGNGKGFNLNLTLPENIDGTRYRQTLAKALARVTRFDPRFLVVSLGLDTAKGDPTGTFTLGAKDFYENGRMIAALGLNTLVVQEGGYLTRTLGVNGRSFFTALWQERPHILSSLNLPNGLKPNGAPKAHST
ncbi:MAG: histone deacetylase family protein [Deltaproteobacteria bacterium]|nr:histone deacetylase family protein [Deltaproteobacteria bacterium]